MVKAIDIIVPCLNSEKTLKRTLNSIINQSSDDIKINPVVVDNGSNDSTKEIAQSFPDVRYIYCSKKGRGHARNAGVRATDSPIIAFVDSDTELSKTWVSELMELFNGPAVGLAQGPIIPTSKRPESALDRFRKNSKLKFTNGSYIELNSNRENIVINTAACMARRSAIEKAGLFDSELNYNEDADLTLKISALGYFLIGSSRAKAWVSYEGKLRNLRYIKRSFLFGLHEAFYLVKRGLIQKNQILAIWRGKHSFIKWSISDESFSYAMISTLAKLSYTIGFFLASIFISSPFVSIKINYIKLPIRPKSLSHKVLYMGKTYFLHPALRLAYTDQKAKLIRLKEGKWKYEPASPEALEFFRLYASLSRVSPEECYNGREPNLGLVSYFEELIEKEVFITSESLCNYMN